MYAIRSYYDRLFIKIISLALDNFESTCGTLANAGTEPITKFFRYQFGFAINNLQSRFGASGYTLAAAVTEFFVYFDNFTPYFHWGNLPYHKK